MAISSPGRPPGSPSVNNIPNQITSARLVLSLALFVFLAIDYYTTALVLFIIAASTDWLDGYWARKYGQVTVLGRILDPFADKMIICGTFIFLAAVAQSMVAPWMVVLIVGRELLVTALRSFLEERGHDFSAQLSGKLKMVVQCVAAGFSIFRLTYLNSSAPGVWEAAPPDWLTWSLAGLVWLTVAITFYSGVGYIFAAIRLFRASKLD
jgi:CDP-diacylglycerol--glycerol-3-phosphate 3-phosphatidyltransferase